MNLFGDRKHHCLQAVELIILFIQMLKEIKVSRPPVCVCAR